MSLNADEEEMPALFMTSMPAGGPTAGLEAIAALIDEEEAAPRSGKRKAASMGTAQVHLALATCDEGIPASPSGGPKRPKASASGCLKALDTGNADSASEDPFVARVLGLESMQDTEAAICDSSGPQDFHRADPACAGALGAG